MTTCFHIMGQIRIQAWNPRRSELFTVTRQVAPLTDVGRKPEETDNALRTRGAKSAIVDCLVINRKKIQ